MRYVLAWDLGTSGAKAGIVSPQGDLLGIEFEPTGLSLLPGGGAEQDPEDWWRSLSLATTRLLARGLVPRASIAAVGVTAQWAGTVAVDRAGKALHPALIWMDSRGARYSNKLAAGCFPIAGYSPLRLLRWIRLTGGAPSLSGKDPIAHILWIRHELPELYDRTFKFLEPKDYLTTRLTGRFTASSDSIAAHWVTDNRRLDRVCYDARLLQRCELDQKKLPELVRAIDVLGPILPEHANAFGLSRDTVVVAGAPDVHSAAIGSGATLDFQAHQYLGTSSWIACHVPRKKTSIRDSIAALPSAVPGRYLTLNSQETAGACLSHLRDNLFFARDGLGTGEPPDGCYAQFDRIAALSPPGSKHLFFLPWLYGERTPVEDSSLRAAFVNYSLNHQRSDLIRAVLEGVALNSRWLFERVEAFTEQTLHELRFIGGGARSLLWCQIFANTLNRPMLIPDQPLASTLLGAAFIAWVALGELDFEDVPNRIRVASRVEPQSEYRSLYDQAYSEFRSLHRALKPTFRRLNPEASR